MAMRPVPGMYPETQSYYDNATMYNYGTGHGAIDYGVPTGTPVLAAEDGVVIFADWAWNLPGSAQGWTARDFQIKPAPGDTATGGGIMVALRNAAGSRWWKAHLSRTDLNTGDVVRKGDVIGYSGNTGSSTGPHLHMSLIPPSPIWSNGYFGAIDPKPYITEAYQPNRYVAWQGAPTGGVGATTRKEWSDMATEEEIRRVVREENERNNAAAARAVLDQPIEVWGNRPDGTPYGGHTSLRHEAAVGTFRGFRDRRIEAGVQAIMQAVSPDTLADLLDEHGTGGAPVDPRTLADELSAALLEHIINRARGA